MWGALRSKDERGRSVVDSHWRRQTKNHFADAYVRERMKMTDLFTSIEYKRVLRDTERNACINFIVTYIEGSSKWLKRERMSAGVRAHLFRVKLPDTARWNMSLA